MEPIRFYKVNAPYGAFSNFSRHAIEVNGKIYPTSEHYYQSQKFIDVQSQETIRLAATPRIAADLGRTLPYLRFDWDDVKIDAMTVALEAKFTQHPDLKELLLSTKNRMLIEESPTDYYWGEGADKSGQNHLGRLLMIQRARFEPVEVVYKTIYKNIHL